MDPEEASRIERDEKLLEYVVSGRLSLATYDKVTRRVAVLLRAYRSDVDSEPIPDVVAIRYEVEQYPICDREPNHPCGHDGCDNRATVCVYGRVRGDGYIAFTFTCAAHEQDGITSTLAEGVREVLVAREVRPLDEAEVGQR